MDRELKKLLLTAPQNLRVGVEDKSVSIIDIVSSSKMEHTSTYIRGRASTGLISTGITSCVISTGFITINHIHVRGCNSAYIGNTNVSGYSIISTSSSLYWGRTTKKTKEKILQQRVVCVKNKSRMAV